MDAFPFLLAEQVFRCLNPWRRPRKTRRGRGKALEREEGAGRMERGEGHQGKRFHLSVTPGPLDTHEPQMAGWGWGGVGEWLTLK